MVNFMKNKLFIYALICSLLTLINGLSNPVFAQKKNSYKCTQLKGKPITVVDTARGRIQLIVWQSDYFRASGWTPEKRCQEVTRRFQKFSDNGTLRFIANGAIDNYQVICVSPQSQDIGCQEENLLMTLEPNDNPIEVMKELFEDAVKTGAMPIRRSQAVLDLEKYFATAPLMSVAPTIIDKPPLNPIDKPPLKPNQPNPPSNPPSGGTTIECPPILCD